jgi:hypothetical protein
MLLWLTAALGCGDKSEDSASSADTTDSLEATEGTLALTFAMDADFIDVMDEAPVGRFWGTIYAAEDVTGIGPDDDAVEYGDVYVESVDLSPEGQTTAVLFTTGALPVGEVTILGFIDSDGNADPDAPSPDAKDPVTLPSDNEFDVIGGQETTVEVYFGLINP